jgi:hypothetical protein
MRCRHFQTPEMNWKVTDDELDYSPGAMRTGTQRLNGAG